MKSPFPATQEEDKRLFLAGGKDFKEERKQERDIVSLAPGPTSDSLGWVQVGKATGNRKQERTQSLCIHPGTRKIWEICPDIWSKGNLMHSQGDMGTAAESYCGPDRGMEMVPRSMDMEGTGIYALVSRTQSDLQWTDNQEGYQEDSVSSGHAAGHASRGWRAKLQLNSCMRWTWDDWVPSTLFPWPGG